MAVSEAFTGTQSVSTTEWSLTNASSTIATQTAVGCYQLFLDLNALAAGDEFQVICYEKVRSADTQRIVWQDNLVGVVTYPNFASPALMLLNGWDFSLKKIAGTDRTITWSIRKAA